jgi:hypothetical protein
MNDAILFIFLIAFTLLIGLILVFKPASRQKPVLFIIGGICLIAIVIIFSTKGSDKFNKDLARIIQNSRPKSDLEVYSLLFKKPIDSCITFIHFKDQVLPKIDCCIWMELTICPKELQRIIQLKKYKETKLSVSDSIFFLQSFSDRPNWWVPQRIGDSLTKCNITFNENNEQSILFGKDSTHVFICDKAL